MFPELNVQLPVGLSTAWAQYTVSVPPLVDSQAT